MCWLEEKKKPFPDCLISAVEEQTSAMCAASFCFSKNILQKQFRLVDCFVFVRKQETVGQPELGVDEC
jgi:hypothetical protein